MERKIKILNFFGTNPIYLAMDIAVITKFHATFTRQPKRLLLLEMYNDARHGGCHLFRFYRSHITSKYGTISIFGT